MRRPLRFRALIPAGLIVLMDLLVLRLPALLLVGIALLLFWCGLADGRRRADVRSPGLSRRRIFVGAVVVAACRIFRWRCCVASLRAWRAVARAARRAGLRITAGLWLTGHASAAAFC